ncbi:MAG: hypothetical protein EOO89_26825, partial [Pedobacter sp.]
FKVAKDASGNMIALGYSGSEQVGASGATTLHTKTGLSVAKNGYLYIYTSNEAQNIDVFFDNLQVTHVRGPLLEETHYYPFGLTMAGISSKAAGGVENKKKYNDMELQCREFSDGLGLEMYEYKYRFYDHQIGRFISQDKLAEKYVYYAPYQFAGNEVPNAIDLDGLEPWRVNNRYMSSTLYAQHRQAYRQVNNYVPHPQAYRTSARHIPNQAAGSKATPVNIYERIEPGDPSITTGRGTQSGRAVTEGIKLSEEVHNYIKAISVTSEHYPSGVNNKSEALISWNNPEAQKQYNKASELYNQKVQEIYNANAVEPLQMNATEEQISEHQANVNASQLVINLKISLLGPTPFQQVLQGLNKTGNYKLEDSKTTVIPAVRQINN